MGIKNWLVGGDATNNLPVRGAHYNQVSNYLTNALGGVAGRPPPMATAAQLGPAAQLAAGPQGQVRGQMQSLADRLGAVAAGQQAGAGELAVNRQTGYATAAQQAAARMARGSNAALAARDAARNTADIGVAGAGQAAMAQIQDQQGANAALSGLLAGIRGQDLDLASQNAQLQQQQMLAQGGFNQQTGLANQSAQLQQTSMNDSAAANYLAQMLGMDAQQFQQMLAQQQLNIQDQGHLASLLQLAGQAAAAKAGGG